jgi:hypothetical protein
MVIKRALIGSSSIVSHSVGIEGSRNHGAVQVREAIKKALSALISPSFNKQLNHYYINLSLTQSKS